MLAESILQHLRIKVESRRCQWYINRLRTAQDRVRTVVLIKRREDDNLIPRVRYRHHSGHHRLGTAAGYDDLTVRVDGAAHVVRLLCSQRLAEILCAPSDGILVVILMGDLGQTVQNFLRRVKIRKPL